MKSVTIRLDLRLLCAVLILVIIGMLAVWQPWTERANNKKTVTVTGQATLEETPDEYVFMPNFNASAATSAEAVAQVTKKGNEVVDALKKMGIHEDQLTTRVDNYATDNGGGPELQIAPAQPNRPGGAITAFYYINCKVKDKAVAQKVTDYLASSGATGGVTPQADFSLETRSQLDTHVRQKAIQDAKSKAETEARELNVRLGEVVSVSEEPSPGGMPALDAKAETSAGNSGSPPVLTGTQRITLIITVTYSIK